MAQYQHRLSQYGGIRSWGAVAVALTASASASRCFCFQWLLAEAESAVPSSSAQPVLGQPVIRAISYSGNQLFAANSYSGHPVGRPSRHVPRGHLGDIANRFSPSLVPFDSFGTRVCSPMLAQQGKSATFRRVDQSSSPPYSLRHRPPGLPGTTEYEEESIGGQCQMRGAPKMLPRTDDEDAARWPPARFGHAFVGKPLKAGLESGSVGRSDSYPHSREPTTTMASHNTASEPPFADEPEDTSVRYSPCVRVDVRDTRPSGDDPSL
jgi:hypothetical protein